MYLCSPLGGLSTLQYKIFFFMPNLIAPVKR